jgi:hypothetical protein
VIERSSLNIVFVICFLAACGMLQFAGLCFHLPFLIIIVLLVAFGVSLFHWLSNIESTREIVSKKLLVTASVLFLIGLFLIVNRGYYLHEKYGLWDAWAFWNIHSGFLADTAYWKNYLNPLIDAHPDYPLGLPATVAFFWRLFSTTNYLVPFSLASFVSILIPAIIFIELHRKNVFIAFLMMLWLVTDDFYIQISLSQFADSWVALYLLCSFMLLSHFQKDGNIKLLTLASAFIALACWAKNEGIMYFGIWVIINVRTLRKKENFIAFLKGITIPMCALVYFKILLAPQNDLLAKSNHFFEKFHTFPSRLLLIKQVLFRVINDQFPLYKIGVILLVFISFLTKKVSLNEVGFIACSFISIALVYLFTPLDLEWHLNNSADRLLSQISPLLVYLIGEQLRDLPLPFFMQKKL